MLGARLKVLAGLAAVAGLILVGLMLARPVNKGGKETAQTEPVEPTQPAPAQAEHFDAVTWTTAANKPAP